MQKGTTEIPLIGCKVVCAAAANVSAFIVEKSCPFLETSNIFVLESHMDLFASGKRKLCFYHKDGFRSWILVYVVAA